MASSLSTDLNGHILLVEDDDAQRQTLTALLSDEGFRVHAAATGKDALDVLRTEKVDVAIVDLRLPDVDGTELLGRFQRLSDDVDVVIHTGNSSYETARDAVNLGASGYVEKGSDPAELLRKIHHVFRDRLRRRAENLEGAVAERTRALQVANSDLQREVEQRRQTDDALRESEQRYRSLLEHAGAGIEYWGLDGICLMMNPASSQSVGRQPWECIGRSITDLFEPEVAELYLTRIRNAAGSKTACTFEDRAELPAGTRWFLSTYARVVDDHGSVRGVQIISHDITSRKQHERKIEQLNETLEAAQEMARLGYWRFDLATGDPTWSDQMFKVYGVPKDEGPLRYEDVRDRTHPEDWDVLDQAVQRCVRGESYNVVVRIRYADRSHHYVNTQGFPVKDENGEIKELFGTSQDVTQLKQAEEELARSERELSTVYDVAPMMMILLDASGKIRRANRSVVDAAHRDGRGVVVGLRSGDVIGCIHALDDPGGCGFGPVCRTCGIRNMVFDTLENGRSHYREPLRVRVDGPDGARDVHLLGSSVRLFLDKQSHVLLSIEDVTEQHMAEQELRQREAEVAHMSRLHTAGEMAGSLAHELNQPLYAINNYVRGIHRRLSHWEESPNLESLIGAMDHVTKEVRRAAGIVSNLRAFVQGREPRRSSIDLGQVLSQAFDLLQPAARDRRVVLEVETDADMPILQADPIQVEQVVVNLVTNAMDAVAGLPSSRRKVWINARMSGEDVIEVVVRDLGLGIPADIRESLFDAFVTSKPTGLGVGLAISRSIVTSHGGRIWAADNQPHGTAFHFLLPVVYNG